MVLNINKKNKRKKYIYKYNQIQSNIWKMNIYY